MFVSRVAVHLHSGAVFGVATAGEAGGNLLVGRGSGRGRDHPDIIDNKPLVPNFLRLQLADYA